VTISKDHSLNPEGMKNILIAAGILTTDGKKTIEGEKKKRRLKEKKRKDD